MAAAKPDAPYRFKTKPRDETINILQMLKEINDKGDDDKDEKKAKMYGQDKKQLWNIMKSCFYFQNEDNYITREYINKRLIE
jgi:hypothetical protein